MRFSRKKNDFPVHFGPSEKFAVSAVFKTARQKICGFQNRTLKICGFKTANQNRTLKICGFKTANQNRTPKNLRFCVRFQSLVVTVPMI
jgi:hypothetical protein